MAKATMKLPEDFLMKVSRLAERTDEILPRRLQAGGEVVEAKVRSNRDETYGTPTSLAKAMQADLSVELAEATLYADDGPAEVVKEFKSGK